MKNTSKITIENILHSQRDFFATYRTKDFDYRIEQLKKFKAAILKYETKITDALWTDLRKSNQEAYLTEISIVIGEIDNHLKNLKKWSKPQWIKTPIHLFPSKSRLLYEPLGVALIIAPWNYPFQLLLNPLVGAISAGCTAVLKASPYTPATAQVMEDLISETFDPSYIAFTQGGREVNQLLLEQRYDVIFFTGSPSLGKTVMKYAAEHLTPVVLELGGKSPCIVDAKAHVKVAAKRIAWGKLINAGQTCIAPDYIFVHQSVKSEFLQELPLAIEELYGKKVKESQFFPRIVNEQNVVRLQGLMQQGKIIYGGDVDIAQKYISPTIIDGVQPDFAIMQEEIFGPLMPILTFAQIDEVLDYVNSHEKPLAFYYFGTDADAKNVLYKTSSGGGCVNDTIMHVANHNMPFGGVGNSGMSNYHGQESFKVFSHARAIISTPTWVDLPLKYPPFTYFKWIKKMM